MIRQLTYADKDAILEVMATRDKVMLSSDTGRLPTAFIEDEANFNRNAVFGYFDEEGLLDVFIHVNIWDELPAYSCLVYTRKKEGKTLRTPLYVNVNMAKLWVFTRAEMLRRGYIEHYQLTAAQGWFHIQTQIEPTSIIDQLEYIPAGELPKYQVFRNRLLNRRLAIDTKITRFILLPEYRDPDKDERIEYN